MTGVRAELPARASQVSSASLGVCGQEEWGSGSPSRPSVQTVKPVPLQAGAELGYSSWLFLDGSDWGLGGFRVVSTVRKVLGGRRLRECGLFGGIASRDGTASISLVQTALSERNVPPDEEPRFAGQGRPS